MPEPPLIPPPICSALSLEAGEALFSTASPVQVYFLLEYNGPWERKAYASSTLPAAVKAHLDAALSVVPQSKLLLLKSQAGLAEAGLRFYVAVAGEAPRLAAFELSGYPDLLALDLPALARGSPAGEAYRQAAPLYLVCTNGRRDPCCARWGLPFFGALYEAAGASVWQCTHVGGHRFAANLLLFPHGLLYGRLRPQDALPVSSAYAQGRVSLEHYRGRSCYPPPAQAAEYYLRQATGVLEVGAFHLETVTALEADRWQVLFRETGRGQALHSLTVAAEPTGAQINTSCQEEELNEVRRFNLLHYERMS